MPDHQTVSCRCSQCEHQVTKSLAWLSDNDHYTCPNCGDRVELDRAAFFQEVNDRVAEGQADLNRFIDGLNKDLAKIGKKPRK